jgi:dTDP-4-amino-4,6-dideoxygalactose transaminase/nucleoside-diphosphate-sugar epimerase
MDQPVLTGGSGFAGTALILELARRGARPVVVDARPPRVPGADWAELDLLTGPPELPPGPVVLLAGCSDPRVRHPWTLPMANAIATARLLPALAGRDVVLCSTAEVYGVLDRDPGDRSGPYDLDAWCERAAALAQEPCPPWRSAALCRELVDPGGRWTYALSKRAQELLVRSAVPAGRLTVLRIGNLFGPGQDRVVAKLARRALHGLPLDVTDTVRCFLSVDRLAARIADQLATPGAGDQDVLGAPLPLTRLAEVVTGALGVSVPIRRHPAPAHDIDVAGRAAGSPAALEAEIAQFVRGLRNDPWPAFSPPVPVVLPPRAAYPDVVTGRQQAAQWSGAVKHGNRWTGELQDRLREILKLGEDRIVLATSSGTAAIRLAVVATAGPASPGDVAVLPSFTFAATGEALAQLGYTLRFADADPLTWTLDPDSVAAALVPGDVKLVMAVDALGNPADYTRLRAVCADAGVPLIGDSAAALGARWDGVPVGTQAGAHAFSMSFAKVVSAAGGGGALVLPADAAERLERPVSWLRSALMGEVHAAAALDQVEQLPELIARREEIASIYAELSPHVRPQVTAPGARHALVHWVARVPDRDAVAAALARDGIGTKPYYSPALHRHDWGPFAPAGQHCPVTDQLVQETLALPMSSELTADAASRIVTAVLAAGSWVGSASLTT